jgi:hypothetical protein
MIVPLAVASRGFIVPSGNVAAAEQPGLGHRFILIQGAAMRRDIKMIRGTSFELQSVARKTDGSIIDLTSATITWRIGTDDFATTKIENSIGDGITVTDATAGKYTLKLTPSKTVNVDVEVYEHQVEVTDASSDIWSVLVGQFRLTGGLE